LGSTLGLSYSTISVTEEAGPTTRYYCVYQPANYTTAIGRRPVILLFHGDGGDGNSRPQDFITFADTYNWLLINLVADDGSGWSFARPPNNPDDQYLQALIPYLVANNNVSPINVFAVGYSSGSYFFGDTPLCSDIGLNFNTVAFTMYTGNTAAYLCDVYNRTNFIWFVGTADDTNGSNYANAQATAADYASINGCSGAGSPTVATVGTGVTLTTYGTCQFAAMELYSYSGMGHEAPLSPTWSPDYVSTTQAFFLAHAVNVQESAQPGGGGGGGKSNANAAAHPVWFVISLLLSGLGAFASIDQL